MTNFIDVILKSVKINVIFPVKIVCRFGWEAADASLTVYWRCIEKNEETIKNFPKFRIKSKADITSSCELYTE